MNTKQIVDYVIGKEANKIRAILRKEFKNRNLEARETYYDYYDSCHPPKKTPDAPWKIATPWGEEFHPDYRNGFQLRMSYLKAGGPLIGVIDKNTFELTTGYQKIEVRIKRGE